jgi:hypothetical protein
MHVAVRVSSTSEYGKFEIDDVLGRLSCPPEPRLLYSKAQFHAFTSFVFPDPLTRRTGTEEALHTLRSGYCQPWTPISAGLAFILRVIGGLSPSREYYPKDKRRLQTVTWDQDLTISVQHDSYEGLVHEILDKSDRLRAFTTDKNEAIGFHSATPSHLRKRGEIRRVLYERRSADRGGFITGKDTVYKSRDRRLTLPQAMNVYQIVGFFRKRPFGAHATRELAEMLQDWELIGGFHHINTDSESISSCLSDLIENNIGEQWGSLVNLCRQTDLWDPYRLIFRLSLLSFGAKPDMDAIRSLAAFGCLDELKVLQPPIGSYFAGFKPYASPTLESLLSLIAADYPVVEPGARRRQQAQSRFEEKHRILCEAEGRRLASFLLEQWPSSEPSADGFKSTVLNGDLAIERILPEWQRLHRNMGLSEYIIQAQEILGHYQDTNDVSFPRAWNKEAAAFCTPDHRCTVPSLSSLLVKCQPLPLGHSSHGLVHSKHLPRGVHPPNEPDKMARKTGRSEEIIELGKILDLFATSSDVLRQKYGNDLKNSLLALQNIKDQPQSQEPLPGIDAIKEDIEKARVALNHAFERVQNTFSSEDDRFQWLQLGSLWPCTTPITILEQLRSSSDHHFGSNMKEGLVAYGILATTLQRLLRIRHAQLKGDRHKLLQEWRNIGHENWSPLEFPDWLLLEIESDLFIRCEQVEVAHAIISPASGSNSVLQMNMGKGK